GQSDPARRSIRVASEMAHAAKGFTNRAIAGPSGIGTVLAIAADAHHDQAGIVGGEGVIAQPQAFEHAWPVVLDEHVGLVDQRAGDGLAFGMLEIKRDAALATHEGDALQGYAVDVIAELAHRVALPGLDLDDIGAEIRQQPCARGTGERTADFNHADARQRAASGLVILCLLHDSVSPVLARAAPYGCAPGRSL